MARKLNFYGQADNSGHTLYVFRVSREGCCLRPTQHWTWRVLPRALVAKRRERMSAME